MKVKPFNTNLTEMEFIVRLKHYLSIPMLDTSMNTKQKK